MIGNTFSHYKILEKLGSGGMGVVYKAEDTRLHRIVALKFFPPEMTRDQESKKRFIIEAQAASSLQHNNICTIHDIEETGEENLFIVMDCYEGESLKDKISQGPLKLDESVDIAIQTACGLSKAHEKNIIHRDVKPANVFITTDETVKILDFGLAKLGGDRTKLTTAGTTLGTIAYMSPEQTRGEEVDNRADIWALGVVLYEMLTGKLPFGGDYDQAVVYSIINENPEPVTGLRTGIPVELEKIIFKALSKDPEDRYQSFNDMIVDLKHVLKSDDTRYSAVREPLKPIRNKKWILISAVSLVFVVLVAILLLLPASGANHQIKSIAVLPLDNLSHNPEQEYFADGMTEELITELSKISGLKVISRTSVMQYKNKKEHLPDIAKELGVDAVIEGSALLVNDNIRITAQLIDASTDQHIWANSYDRKLADVLSLHKEVAREIANGIKIKLSPEEQKNLSGAKEVDPKAYELVLKGRYIFKHKFTLADRLKAIEYYNQAIKIDSGFALAYAYLANAVRYLGNYGYIPSELKEKVRVAVLKSLELDPDLAFAHMQYGMYKFYYEWDWASTEKELKKALELEPNNADVYAGFASYYGYTGQYEKGFEANRMAQKFSPLAMDLKNQRIWLCFQSRRYDKGIEYVHNLMDMEKHNPTISYWLVLFNSVNNDCDKALLECKKLEDSIMGSDNPSPELFAVIGWVNGKCGKREKAETYLKKIISSKGWIDPGIFAVAYLGVRNYNEAIRWTEKAFQDKTMYCFFIQHAEIFDKLRSYPKVQKLIAESGLL